MKARVKATGKIINVKPAEDSGFEAGCYPYHWFDAKNNHLYDEQVLEFGAVEDMEPDYWEKLKHQAAIAAMQGICSNYNDFTKNNDGSVSNTEMICENAKIIATALVNRLKEDSQCEK